MENRNQNTLYHPGFEHDNCGIGAVVNINGRKSHAVVADALKIVENLEHRAGKDAKGETGDGVGIILRFPIISSGRCVNHLALKSAMKENTESGCFSSRRMN